MNRLSGFCVRLLETCLLWFRAAGVCVLFAALLLPPQLLHAAAPAWWGTQGVLDPAKAVDDYAPLNQGQLKNLVRAAVAEMNAKLPGGAGSQLTTLLATWRAAPLQANDYAMANVGQLKAVGSLVYLRLWQAGMPLAPPWTTPAEDDDDYGVANVGQAKATFKFTVPDIVAMGDTDSDEDGYSDAVETAMGTNPSLANNAPAAAPPGFEPPLVKPTLKMHYRVLNGGAWMMGFSDFSGHTARMFTTKSTSLTSDSSVSSSGTNSWQSFRSDVTQSSTWENVEVRQGIGASHMTQEEFLPAEITTNNSTYMHHSDVAGVKTTGTPDYYFSDYKTEKTGGMESTETKLTYSYKNLGGSVHAPVTTTSVEEVPGSGNLLYLDSGPTPTITESATTTTRTFSFTQYDVLTGGEFPITRNASGSMTETLSGEVTMTQVIAAMNGDIAYPEGTSEQSSTSPSLISHFTLNPSSASAVNYEYRFTLEWPAGTPASMKDRREYLVTVTERYESADHSVVEQRQTQVPVSSLSGTPTMTLSALGYNGSRSGLLAMDVSSRPRPGGIYGDLNNDGQLTIADTALADLPFTNGASAQDKDKGTEFMFANDELSNGAWDKEDSAKPSSATDDDDVEALHITPGIAEGDVWLDHPAIDSLKFYTTKACEQEIHLSPGHHFILDSSHPLPETVFARAEDTSFKDMENPQVEGNLRLLVRPLDGVGGTEVAKMKLTIVKSIGARKYFHAVRDYILENNVKMFTNEKTYSGGVRYRIVAMREESTSMAPFDSYDHVKDRPKQNGIEAVSGSLNADAADVIINGNQCFFSFMRLPFAMTDRCEGRYCAGGVILRPPSDDTHHALGGALGRYVGHNIAPQSFTFGAGPIPEPATIDNGLGGLSTNYTLPIRLAADNQSVGRAKVWESGKGVIFTATNYVGEGGASDLLARDAENSGVQPLSGGNPGDLELFFLDGSTSVGLVLKDPSDTKHTLIKGDKHDGWAYYINTYLLFRCQKPRP